MPRDHKRLHAYREPVAPRPAATVLLIRDSAPGFEVLMTRRSVSASFAPGAYVFPGGALDATDAAAAARAVSRVRPTQDEEIRAFSVAAAREAFEELGILLAYDCAGELVSQEAVDALDRSPQADFLAQVAGANYTLAVDRIWWLCHWITDRDLPKRFDARFFVARMPPGQTPRADEGEQFDPVWITPAAALERHVRGEFDMIFPTIRTLRRLATYPDADAVIAACRDERPLWTSCPRGGRLNDLVERFSEHEPAFGELELVAPDGRVLHSLDWRHDTVVPLMKHVARLTAPNPGMMTGPGTNTYIVGDADSGYLVVDPGPDDRSHVDRIARHVGDRLRFIFCTHSHPDHAPGAAMLKSLVGGEILGRPTGPFVRDQWPFEPDRVVAHGDTIALGDSTLRVIHTPGHASNHVCLLLEEDALLFSGDHINNGSTVVIGPPDGDMSAYLASLRALSRERIRYILPAHGWVLGFADQAVTALIRHRLQREDKVMGALAAAGSATLSELLPRVYDDVSPKLHPVAARSLLAHLEKLEADGRARRRDALWEVA